ncbi:MAG TPA: GntR family transcriptional regulator [Tepidisphaeraceae bacterium]|jgi:GntR family transcriptional regulator
MFLRLEPSSGVPITRQIADQVRAHCAAGTLAPGDRLPSVRQLAQQLAINQNTVLRVYERLTAEGLLERRHGDGTYIADRLPPGRLKAQRELLRQEVERLARRATDLGIDATEVHELLDEATAKLASERGASTPKGGHRDE